MGTGRNDDLFITNVQSWREHVMIDASDNKSEPSPIDDAATEQATGGYTVNSGGNAPLFKRNDQWAQEGVDHKLDMLHGPQSNTPADAMHGAHSGASSSRLGGNAFAGAGSDQTFFGPGGTSGTAQAGAFGNAHAGPTGLGAATGAHAGITFKANENLSFGSNAHVGASGGTGLGLGSMTANAQVGAGVETHIDAGIKGRLGAGLDASTNTHVESGFKAEAGARGSVGLNNQFGANSMAGDYLSVTQSGGIQGHGLGAKGSVGVITPGSAGIGTHAGLNLSDGKINLNIGGALAVGLGGLTGDATLSVDTKPLVDAAKAEAEALKWAGKGIAHGTTVGAETVFHGTKQAVDVVGHGVTSGANTAVHATGDAFKTAGQGIVSGGNTAIHATGNAFNTAGNGIVTGGGALGNAFKNAGNTVGHGLEDAGRSVGYAFTHW